MRLIGGRGGGGGGGRDGGGGDGRIDIQYCFRVL